MEQTLKITNVLADPTRYSIYDYIVKKHGPVTVQEIADQFSIHPNVARLHLSKLEDIKMIVSENLKTGKGGRPSRVYRLSDEVIELSFPFRDYRLLAKIALETMLSLGKDGEEALYTTGKQYGKEIIEKQLAKFGTTKENLTFEQKIQILRSTMNMLGFYPDIYVREDNETFFFEVYNCPFRELAEEHTSITCTMHMHFINGLLEGLFDDFQLKNLRTMFDGCQSCAYNVLAAR